ncbi:hypothetical protein [Paenibacillus spongiae]|uniref:Uncharacterized protein n=1 Tax=Paenibacillus spongiae TaxID=2909671 RepID=A0ABY5SG82_9BACL|nr:hypothetical protein [Paenibacillus spongiae]UVI31722.1 hypothetical protein L1F29_07870 [Paenibacillus spongiae]
MRSKTNSAIRRWFWAVLFLSVTTVLVSACGDDRTASEEGKLRSVNTSGTIAYAAGHAAEDQIEAVGLMGVDVYASDCRSIT